MAGKVEDKTVFKYKAVYPQAPMDMRYHYYDRGILKVNAGLFKLVTTIEELEEFAKECEGQIIGVDTETTGLTYKQDQIVGFSISYTPFSGIYVPIRHALRRTDKVKTNLLDNKGMPLLTKTGKVRTHTVNKHTDFENPANLNPKAALDILDRIMRNAKLCVLHNSEFDLNMIAQEGYDFRKYKTLDTMVLTYLFDAENKSWGKLKEASKIILGRYPTKFEEALGSEENFRYVDLEVAYPYAASDSANTLGIFMNLYPKVKELLNKAPNVLDLGEGRYNVMNRDNELIRAFTDYYGHALIKVNRKTAQEYKDRVEKYLAEVEDKIYSYFKKGQFNLSTSSKEFKQTMEDFNIDTGARTEKGAVSYGKAGIENMTRTLRALKDILQLDWNTKIDYQNGRLNKRASLDELKLAEMITVYGKEHFDFKDSANFLTIRSIEGIKLEKHEFFQELALMYKSATTKMDILKAIQTRSSLMKALNSYITKLTEVDECRMRYRLTGTSSGRLSSGNGSKSDKKKNHYYIDLNAQNLTKPHSAYYRAFKSDEEGNILGWKFELVDEDYYKAHKEEEIIVEGSSPSNNIRACFEAPEGRLIASLDYSAQEYRVLAILSQDHRMVDNFKKGIDPHTATAYAIWGEENYDRQKRKKAKGCVGDGTLISTTRGQVPVENLLPTDKLIGVDGKPQNYVMTDYEGDLIDIEWSNGLKSSFTPNHPVQVWDGTKIRWKAVSCLTKDDEVISYVGNYNENTSEMILDCSDMVKYDREGISKQFNITSNEFAYIAGLYLGDGSTILRKGIPSQIRFCADDNIIDYVKHCLNTLGLRSSTPRKLGKNNGTNEVSVVNKAFTRLINKYFGRTKDKHLDKSLLSLWNKEALQYFLAGLVDSDGTTAFGGYISISNTVDEVIYAVTRAANSIGIKCHLDKKVATLNGIKYPYKEVTFYDLGDNVLPIKNPNRVPSSKGRSRRGTWSVSEDYKNTLRKTICNGEKNHALYDLRVCVRNILDGHSKLNKNNLAMMSKFGYEQPIKSNMQCVKPLSFNKRVGHINVIETENHTYVADQVGSHNCNFLMNYCGGPKTLAENLDIPFEEAKEIIELYEKAYFECIQWKRRTMDDAIKRYDGVAYTRFGRPRQFKTLLSTASMWQDFKFQKENAHIMSAQDLTRKGIGVEEAVKRKIVSHAIQSTCGDICRWDLIQLYRRYFKNRDPHIDFMTTVHDEINYTIDKDYVIDYVREIDDIMTFTALSKELPIITSIDLGYSLGILFPFEWEDETRTNLVPLRA